MLILRILSLVCRPSSSPKKLLAGDSSLSFLTYPLRCTLPRHPPRLLRSPTPRHPLLPRQRAPPLRNSPAPPTRRFHLNNTKHRTANELRFPRLLPPRCLLSRFIGNRLPLLRFRGYHHADAIGFAERAGTV